MKKNINKKIIIVALSITLLSGGSPVIAETPNIEVEVVQEKVTTEDIILLELAKETLKENTSTLLEQEITTESAIQISAITFRDRVFNTKSDKGIEAVKVIVFNANDEVIYETKTDENGDFTIVVMPGEYSLTFEKDGFIPTQQTVQINEQERSF